MSGQEDYKRQKQKVIDLKRNNEEVPPVELYKLAGLLQRWAVSDKLPVCLLCQDSSKKVSQLGHIIPHSMLKLVKDLRTLDFVRGANSHTHAYAYKIFCMDCESRFQQGETWMNAKFFEHFFKNPKEKIEVKTKMEIRCEGGESVVFPWFFYIIISIVWRCLAVIPDSCGFLELLEVMRKFLINWNANIAEVGQKIKLFLFAPNEGVDNKLEGCQQNSFCFYQFFHANFEKIPKKSGWIYLGPLHVNFYFSEPSVDLLNLEYGIMPIDTEVASRCPECELTAEADTFVIDESKSRFFPPEMFDQICKVSEVVSSTRLRVPGASRRPTRQDVPKVRGLFLHLLPKDVSYNKGKFDFPSSIYKHFFEDVRPAVISVGVMIGNKRGLFVSLGNAFGDGRELAIGLLVQGDNTVTYMKGVHIPQNVCNREGRPVDLTTPPFKKMIEAHYKDTLQKKFDNALSRK